MWPFGWKAPRGRRAVFRVYQGSDGLWRWNLMLDSAIVAEGAKDRMIRSKSDCLLEVEALLAALGGLADIEVERP